MQTIILMDSISCRRSTSTNPSVFKVESNVKIFKYFCMIFLIQPIFQKYIGIVITFHCCVVLVISNVFKVMSRNRFQIIGSTSPINTSRKLLKFKEQISYIISFTYKFKFIYTNQLFAEVTKVHIITFIFQKIDTSATISITTGNIVPTPTKTFLGLFPYSSSIMLQPLELHSNPN